MDQYPYREDGRSSINESIRFIDGIWKRMQTFGMERFGQLLVKGEATEISATMRAFIAMQVCRANWQVFRKDF